MRTIAEAEAVQPKRSTRKQILSDTSTTGTSTITQYPMAPTIGNCQLTTKMKQQRRRMLELMQLAMLFLLPNANAFLLPQQKRLGYRLSLSQLHAQRHSSNDTRKARVRDVLEKAKSRTGIRNSSTDRMAVAEAASLGGVMEDLTNRPMSSPIDNEPAREIAAIASADIPAAFSEALPFTLPKLTSEQKNHLANGERIQEQSKMGLEGSGYVVLDVKAPPHVVWECLLDFETYPQTIPTVRDVQFFSSNKLNSGYHAEIPIDPSTGRELRHYGTPSTTRAAFCLSKFRLNIAAIHNYRPHPSGDYMIFTLDPECTNPVLQNAKGIWHTQRNPDGRGEDWTRVWLLCDVQISPMLPSFIVEYTAQRAMPRATAWLKPQVEAAAKLWLKNSPDNKTKPE